MALKEYSHLLNNDNVQERLYINYKHPLSTPVILMSLSVINN
jgi:hypothetical protein